MDTTATSRPINGQASTKVAIQTPIKTSYQALYQAANTAGYAPSIHNTQPWRWRLVGGNLDLFAEPNRILDVTDPDQRLATLSCGAALHHARIALAAQGRHVTVTRLPDPANPNHLARLRLDDQVSPPDPDGPVGPEALHQAQAIRLRHTDRRPVTGDPVGPDVVLAITAAVESQHTSLHFLRPDQVLDLAAATSHAQSAEASQAQWQEEMAQWTGDDRPVGAGIPDAVIPQAMTQTTVPGRDFGRLGQLSVGDEHDRPAVFAVLYGPGDERIDWLRAGEALSAGWLTATGLGVSLLPFSAPIEVVGARETLRRLVSYLGYPYLAVRLGHYETPGLRTGASPDTDAPHTPRLPTDQIIDTPPAQDSH